MIESVYLKYLTYSFQSNHYFFPFQNSNLNIQYLRS